MRKLHKKPLIMAAATLALTGTLAVGSAMAYFTTYSTAGGGVKMNMGFTETVPKEDVDIIKIVIKIIFKIIKIIR